MKKSIYLDSNDFSVLSEPDELLRPEDSAVLTALSKARANEQIIIPLSPPLLSEAVHATEASKEHALRRANLMRELCGTNFLIYPTDIWKLEFSRALTQTPTERLTLNDILSGEGQWFGTSYDTGSLRELRQDAQQKIDERIDQLPNPRSERRKLKSQLKVSKASARPLLRRLINEGQTNDWQTDFLLSLIDRSQFIDWILGEKTDFDLHKQLRSIMSDPYILFGHVIDRIGHREQLYNLVRKNGANLSTSLQAVGENIVRLCELALEIREPLDASDLTNQIVSTALLRKVVTPLSGQSLENLNDDEFLALIGRCPSAATFALILREYLASYVHKNLARFRQGIKTPSKPKFSDFGDLMHLLYLPYVDVFRCDDDFGKLLRKGNIRQGQVASRRVDILSML